MKKDVGIEMLRRKTYDRHQIFTRSGEKSQKDLQITRDYMGRRTEPRGTGKGVIRGRNNSGFCHVLRYL